MAIVTAVKSGNWSDPTVWNTGALPQVGDTVRPGAYVVAIDQDVEALSLSAQSGAVGTFGVTGQIRIEADIDPRGSGNYGANGFVQLTNPSGTAVTIIGNIYGGDTASSLHGVVLRASGGVDIIGNLYGGSMGFCYALATTSAGDRISVTGDIYAGTGSSARGAYITASREIVIFGNLFGSPTSTAPGLQLYGTQPMPPRITGNIYGMARSSGLYLQSVKTKAVYIIGDVFPYEDGIGWPAGFWTEAISNLSTSPVIVSGKVSNTKQGWPGITGPWCYDTSHWQPYVDLPYVDPATDEISLQRYRAGVNPQLTATVQPRPQVVCTVGERR